MGPVQSRHPGAVCVYFLCVLLPMIFGIDPLTAGMGLLSGALLLWLLAGHFPGKEFLGYLGIVLFSGVVNPLFNHNGETPLFFLNSNPVTREALLYGWVMGMLIAAALIWSRCFLLMMDTDRLLTVMSCLSPKVSLILSMALRYVPLLRRQARMAREAQAGLGLIREENGLDRMKGAVRVFDGMVTWGLENGITLADSMSARGYGTGKRTRYVLYPWEGQDTLLTAGSLGMMLIILGAKWMGWIGYNWYPRLVTPAFPLPGIAAYLLFAALCLAAPVLELWDRVRWRRMISQM